MCHRCRNSGRLAGYLPALNNGTCEKDFSNRKNLYRDLLPFNPLRVDSQISEKVHFESFKVDLFAVLSYSGIDLCFLKTKSSSILHTSWTDF